MAFGVESGFWIIVHFYFCVITNYFNALSDEIYLAIILIRFELFAKIMIVSHGNQ